MDKATLIELARQAGLKKEDYWVWHIDPLGRFAALVAARERERYEAHRLQQEAWNIDTQYASLLALMLECMILDPRRWHDDAVKVLDQYRAEWDKLNPSPSPFGKD